MSLDLMSTPDGLTDRTSRRLPEWNRLLQRNEVEMLVLSRNDNINIVVVEIRGDKVRLGIEAPKEIPVHRREVYESIMRDRKSAAGLSQTTETP